MKVRVSFVANSSSSSFVLLVNRKNDAQITIPNIMKITIKDFYDLYDNEDNYSSNHYRCNWIPESLDEAYAEAVKVLKGMWIRRLLNNDNLDIISDIAVYAETSANIILRYESQSNSYSKEDLIRYFKNEYTYVGNTYDLMRRILKDYYDNFILLIRSSIENKAKSFANDNKPFDMFYKVIMDIDNSKGFSFQQYVSNLQIHNNGIFKVNPLSSDKNYSLCNPSNIEEMERNATFWYNLIIQQMISIKKLLIMYLYCYFSGSNLQMFTIDDRHQVDKIMKELYGGTGFRRPFANFDLIEVIEN